MRKLMAGRLGGLASGLVVAAWCAGCASSGAASLGPAPGATPPAPSGPSSPAPVPVPVPVPAITVSAPAAGARVTSPVTVSGTADVFEAAVSYRVLSASGAELARGFTKASCGTGCRGAYTVTVSFRVTAAQAGTIEVYAVSAKDGTPVNVRTVPVTLLP